MLSLLANRLRRPLQELFASVAILDLAMGAALLYEPLFLYNEAKFSIGQILSFYLAIYILYFIALPLGARIGRRFGFEHTIFFSGFFQIATLVCLFYTPHHWVFIPLTIVLYCVAKFLYWPSYHANMAYYSQRAEGAREISNLLVLSGVARIAGPFLGGFLIANFGFGGLFVVVSVLVVLSNVPMLITREQFLPTDFEYKQTYRDLLRPQNRRLVLGMLGFAEEYVGMVLWPIMILWLIPAYDQLGLVISIATGLTFVATLAVGHFSDFYNRGAVLRLGAGFLGLSYFMRLVVQGPLGVLCVQTLSQMAKNTTMVPLLASIYGHARSTGHIMRHIVLMEAALVLGKIAIMLVGLLVWWVVGAQYFFVVMFVVSGLASLLYMATPAHDKKLRHGYDQGTSTNLVSGV